MPTSYVTLALLSCCIMACSSSSDKKDPLLEEAAQYHQQATAIQEVVEPQIEQIDSLKATMAGRSDPATKIVLSTLDSLKTAFTEWEANLVEVPGMPHEHHHGKGEHEHHHHNDATLKDLPAEQMRDLQREMLNNIRQIQARLNGVMPPK